MLGGMEPPMVLNEVWIASRTAAERLAYPISETIPSNSFSSPVEKDLLITTMAIYEFYAIGPFTCAVGSYAIRR